MINRWAKKVTVYISSTPAEAKGYRSWLYIRTGDGGTNTLSTQWFRTEKEADKSARSYKALISRATD